MAAKHGLLLAPGAGASSDTPVLVDIEHALKPTPVRRMDFPYRLAGRKAPDRQPVLVDAFVAEAKAFAKQKRVAMKRMVFGGRSMGGRIGSIVAAENLEIAGLILISYPLHPPGKPDKLRIDHFPQITVPTLFISGTRDAFGTPAELKRHIKKIPGETTIHLIDGADHSLRHKDEEVVSVITDWWNSRFA